MLTLLLFFWGHSLWRSFYILSYFLKLLTLGFSIIILAQSIIMYGNKFLIVVFSLFVVILNSFLSGAYYGDILWHFFVLVIGAKGVSFNRIVKIHLCVEICLCLANMVAFKLGLIDKSLIFLADEREDMFGGDVITRLSFGYPAATDFATHVFYMLLDYWIIKNGKLNIFEGSIYIVVISFIVHYCDARQAAACIFLIVLCSIYIYYIRKRMKPTNKLLCSILLFSIPLFFFLSLVATLLYDNTDIYWIAADMVLSGRLNYGNEAILENGIHLLGQTVEMHGAGRAGGMNEYNYVDCAYIQFLLRWGILMMAIILIVFYKIGKDAIRRNDIVLLFSLFVVGVSSIITQFLFHENYCIVALALLATHNNHLYEKKFAKINKKGK